MGSEKAVHSIKMIHLFVGILLFLFLLVNPPVVPGAPLLPLPETEDLLVMDSGSGHVLRISPAGLVGVEINRSEILALTGGVFVLYQNKGIAIDAAGALYVSVFTGSPGGFFGGDTSILKKTPDWSLEYPHLTGRSFGGYREFERRR